MNKNAITQKQQNHLTKICKYCGGTGMDIFNKKDVCPNCILPYQVIINEDNLKEELIEENHNKLMKHFIEINPTLLDDDLPDACDGWLCEQTYQELKDICKQ